MTTNADTGMPDWARELLQKVRAIDPDAEWSAADSADSRFYCLLVAKNHGPAIMKLFPESSEDPNDDPGIPWTRVVLSESEIANRAGREP